MSRKASILSILSGMALIGSLAACGGGSTNTLKDSNCKAKHANVKTLKPGTLAVSVFVSPPYTVKTGDTFGGVDGQIISKIAAMECLALDAKPVAGAGLIASVLSEKADSAMGGIYYTKDRAQTLNLTDSVYQDGMALLSKSGAKSLDDLVGKKVGVVQGYLWNDDLQKALGKDNVKLYQATDGMLTDLSNGRLQVAVLTNAEAGFRAKQTPAAALKVETIAATPKVQSSKSKSNVVFPLTKDNASLTTALNEDIKALLADGTIAKILTDNGMSAGLAGGSIQ